MLTLTDNAVRKFKEFLEKEGVPDSGIRISLVSGCCSPSLAMDIANNVGWGDTILEKDNLKVFLEQKANNLLLDAIIDFNEEYGFFVV